MRWFCCPNWHVTMRWIWRIWCGKSILTVYQGKKYCRIKCIYTAAVMDLLRCHFKYRIFQPECCVVFKTESAFMQDIGDLKLSLIHIYIPHGKNMNWYGKSFRRKWWICMWHPKILMPILRQSGIFLQKRLIWRVKIYRWLGFKGISGGRTE